MTSYNQLSKLLHWVVAIGMIAIAALGVYMEYFEAYAWYGFHKSVGMLLLVVIIYRVIKRMKEGFAQTEATLVAWQALAAKATHILLLAVTLLFPISGMMMSIGGGRGAEIFGLVILAANIDPISEKVIPLNETVASIGGEVHDVLLDLLIVLLVLHIGAAFKHHFLDKDSTLTNMLSFKTDGK